MGAPKNKSLTQRDLEVAAFVWQCFKTEPTIDYNKLASIAGFKNAASANACWGSTKKKLLAQGKAVGQPASAAASPTTPKMSSHKRKTTSATKGAKTPAKKGKITQDALDDENEYGDVLGVKNDGMKDENDHGSDNDTFACGVDRKDSFFA